MTKSILIYDDYTWRVAETNGKKMDVIKRAMRILCRDIIRNEEVK